MASVRMQLVLGSFIATFPAHLRQNWAKDKKKGKKSRFAATHGIRMGLDRMEVKTGSEWELRRMGGATATLFAGRKRKEKRKREEEDERKEERRKNGQKRPSTSHVASSMNHLLPAPSISIVNAGKDRQHLDLVLRPPSRDWENPASVLLSPFLFYMSMCHHRYPSTTDNATLFPYNLM